MRGSSPEAAASAAFRAVEGQRFLVVGLGKSGAAAAQLLLDRGAEVVINDTRDMAALGEVGAQLARRGATFELGAHPEALFTSPTIDAIVVSPGVPRVPALVAAEAAGKPIHSEIELASWFISPGARVVGITGTNGKSTVTTLVGLMCEAAGLESFTGGNLGTPLVDVVGSKAAAEGGVLVVELSSYQLERVERFRANVAVLLNVSPDHLDRYDSYEDYIAAKANIFKGQQPQDVAIGPTEALDAACAKAARASQAIVRTFGPGGDARADGGRLVIAGTEGAVAGLELATAELRIRGTHNHDNACAAALAARALGISSSVISKVLREYPGLPHRMEHVRDVSGVTFIDDSKATNVGAAVAAIAGLAGPGRVVLIAGGRDKKGGYVELREVMAKRGRALVTIGEAAQLIEAAFEGSGIDTRASGTMNEAVELAFAAAEPGDTVLLAPACSSFDMYKSYAHRGDVFQDAVRKLEEAS